MNLKPSMELAGQNLLNCLWPTHNNLPYWSVTCDHDYRAHVSFSAPWHNLGRWWDAVLLLEHATDFVIPGNLEAAMLGNLHRFFDNPDHLCITPPDWERIAPGTDLHSLRESLLALNALVRFRHSRWAAEKGHRMLETILKMSRLDGSWDLAQSDHFRRTEYSGIPTATTTHGRLIEALVWFYEVTGDALALELADRFARYHLEHSTQPDGQLHLHPSEYTEVRGQPHTHSYLGTLRGLLLFGELTRQHEYVEAVATTYRVTVRQMIKQSGFVSHDLSADNRGETSSPGDAAQLALWLARLGHTEYLDDAERIVRTRLIPAQITESPGLHPPEDGVTDEHLHPDELIVGAIGGMHREPHAGKNSVTDINAACLHTLVDIYGHIAVRTEAGVTVNFHFDTEDENVRVKSLREQEAKVTVVAKKRDNLLIRVPGWTPPESVKFVVNGNAFTPVRLGNYAAIPRDLLPGEIILRYALPAHTSLEETDGVEYEFAWQGDEVIGIAPNSDFFPFYSTRKSA